MLSESENERVYREALLMKKSKLSKSKYGYQFCLPYFIIYLIMGVFPILFTFYVSLMDWNGIGAMKFVGLGNYIKMFQPNYNFLKSLKNTVLMLLVYVPVTLAIGLLLANALFRPAIRLKTFFRTSNLMPYIVSSVCIGTLFSFLFDYPLGGINALLSLLGVTSEGVYWLGQERTAQFVVCLMVVWKYMGYYMVMFLAGLTNIPNDIVEAAQIDGANSRQLFFKIKLPAIRPTLTFLVITACIGGFQLIEEPMLVFSKNVGGPNRSVLTTAWNIYDTAFGSKLNFGIACAMSYGLFAAIALFSVLGFNVLNGKEK